MPNQPTSITRRRYLQSLAGTGGAFLSTSAFSAAQARAQNETAGRPNIVLIISDDQAWGDYGFMGHEAIQTPHLDRLAQQSVVFTRGYVAAPLCCPSLASIITGLHPHQHKITSNDPPYTGDGPRYSPNQWPEQRQQLREKMISHIDRVPTLPRRLHEPGYLSMQTGKWWLGSYKRGGFTHGMTHGDIERGGRHGDEGLTIGREGMQPIAEFLDHAGDRPFFLWYAPFLPHRPHNPPERLLSKYRDQTGSIHIARYWAMCEWFDETCGSLLQMLDERHLADNTIVLYVCDNGWIQKPDVHGYAPRSKRTPYEGGVRTPIMVRWPGHAEPRFDESTLVSAVDLAPTILRACGLPPTEAMPGLNLLDTEALTNRSTVFGGAYTHDAVDVDTPLSSLKYTYALEKQWKLIQPSGRNETGKEPELYDVFTDPHETENLAQSHSKQVHHLQNRIKNWWSAALPE